MPDFVDASSRSGDHTSAKPRRPFQPPKPAPNSVNMPRGVRARPPNRNAGLVTHLTEWRDSVDRFGASSRLYHTLNKAIMALLAHPTTVRNQVEAKAVKGIGDYIASSIAVFIDGGGDPMGGEEPDDGGGGGCAAVAGSSAAGAGRGGARGSRGGRSGSVSGRSGTAEPDGEEAAGFISAAVKRRMARAEAASARSGTPAVARQGGARVIESSEDEAGPSDSRAAFEADVGRGGRKGGGRGGRGGGSGRGRKRKAGDDGVEGGECQGGSSKKKNKKRMPVRPEDYDPKYRSGPHGILIALLHAYNRGEQKMRREKLILEAQPFCDESFEPASGVTSATGRYNAWSSMTPTLINKGIVNKVSSPAWYSLTVMGLVTAQRALRKDDQMNGRSGHVYDPDVRPPRPQTPPAPSPVEPEHRPFDLNTMPSARRAAASSRQHNVHAPFMQPQATEWGNPPSSASVQPESDLSQQQQATRQRPDWQLTPSKASTPPPAAPFSTKRLPTVKRSESDITEALKVAKILLNEGYGAKKTKAAILKLFAGLGAIPDTQTSFCDVLRPSLPYSSRAPSAMSIGLALSELGTSLRSAEAGKPAFVEVDLAPVGAEGGNDVAVEVVEEDEIQPAPKRQCKALSDAQWKSMAARLVRELVDGGRCLKKCLDALETVVQGEVETETALRASVISALGPFPGAGAGPSTAAPPFVPRCGALFTVAPQVDARAQQGLAGPSAAGPSPAPQPAGEASRNHTVRPLAVDHRPSGVAPRANVLAVTEPISDATIAKIAAQMPPVCEIKLLLDNREVYGNGAGREKYVAEMEEAMLSSGLPIVQRVLPVGDALFIAKLPNQSTEIVLDWIVERKTLSDFISSLGDGRIKKQVSLMNGCGLSNRMVLVEGQLRELHVLGEAANRSRASIDNELNDLHVCHGIFVHFTKNRRQTVDMFVSMHRRLVKRFGYMDGAKVAEGRVEYRTWNESEVSKAKAMSLKELWLLQLCSIHGLGPKGAEAVVARGLDTPGKLAAAYRNECGGDPAKMKAFLAKFNGKRCLNATGSLTLYNLFNLHQYDTTLVD